ncbi:MAG: hypothetical protein DI598_06965 [Pseudopedobacter saltans]|uniref:RNA polymerase sigma-70 factor n=1 Tax=Pseudopedobacter saltans TaxID=151895 RepID=A0A2W5F0U0_9SPHI|nr:MAG: hypothetical protein DI598_06965 [Pseudopedobacter saltans]
MEVLFRTYYTSLCYHAYTVTHDRELSEDIVQETFVRYWQYAKDQEVNNPKAWLYRAVYNASLNAMEKRDTYQRSKEGFSVLHVNIRSEKTQELLLVEAETARSLWGKVKELPPQCREVIRMSFVEGLSNKEIADLMQLHVSTVKTQKQRGLSILRKVIFHLEIWLPLCRFIFF